MNNLYAVLVYMYPNAIPIADFRIQDDGTGVYIAYWNTAKLGAQPTQAQLNANELPALKAQKIRAIRDALNAWYLQDVRSVEGDVTVYKKAVGSVLTAEETSIFNTVNSNYQKRNTAIASVNAATTVAQADAVAMPVWDRVS